MVTRENHLPYDRPKLSKAMHLTPDNITLRSNQFYEVRACFCLFFFFTLFFSNYIVVERSLVDILLLNAF